MAFKLAEATEILSRTPTTLCELLGSLSSSWITATEGPETWSPYDVVGHLITAETNNWMVRADAILSYGEKKPFEPFDRFAHFETSKEKTLASLLDEFSVLRERNLQTLRGYGLTEEDFDKLGRHPEFGKVRLSELLATWVVHDLSHIRQIVRTMAKHYETEVGPWRAYLTLFQE